MTVPKHVSRDASGAFVVEPTALAEAFGVPAEDVQPMLRTGAITSLSETGEGEHAGTHRLTFFCRNRRFRLVIDDGGRILRRSVVSFGDRPLPAALRRPGAP